MFSIFKNKSDTGNVVFRGGLSSKQKEFLEIADKAYLMTIRQMDMSHIAKFVTRNLYMIIYRSITIERPWTGISPKFMNVVWTLREEDSCGSLLVTKEVTFDRVKVSKQLSLSVADDFKELWVLVKEGKDYKINNIEVYGG